MLKNGLYNAVGGVVRMGLNLVLVPWLIYLLGLEQYGLWVLVSSALAIVTLAEGGLAVATTVFVGRDLGQKETEGISQTLTATALIVITLSTIASLGLGLGAEGLVGLLGKLTPEQRLEAMQALQISGLVVWTRLVQQVAVGVEQAYQRYDLLNLLNTGQVIASSLSLVVVAQFGGNVVALMQSQVVVGGVMLLAHGGMTGWLMRGLPLCWSWNQEKAKSLISFSTLTWLSTLGTVLFSQGDRLIVGSLLGAGPLAIYATISSIVTQINTFSAMIVQPILPAVTNLLGQEPAEIQRKGLEALHLNVVVALGLGAGLFALAPWVLPWMIPTVDVARYVPILRVMVVIYSLYSTCAVGYYLLFGLGAVKVNTLTQLIFGAVSLLAISVGAANLGLIGAALGNAGYLGVFLLNQIGLGRLGLPGRIWVGSALPGFICFGLGCVLVLLLPIPVGLGVLALQGLFLGLWLARSQGMQWT